MNLPPTDLSWKAFLGTVLLTLAVSSISAETMAHVWEKQEITLTAKNTYASPYTQVIVWLDLAGPNFNKRIYGFWDGGQTYRIRLMATAPGRWCA